MTSALVNAVTGMGYQNVDTNGNTVTFTFDTPHTPQPRMDYPQLVSVVRAANQEIVTTYDSLGLTSNDPNTVGDQAAAAIGRSFAIYSAEFFQNVIANLAKLFGIAVSDAIRTLTEGFSMALDAASQFVTNAGYTFTSWINGVADFISEALDFSCVIEISNRGGPYELVRDSVGVGHGNWAVEPPQAIPAGGVGRFWLRDPKPSPFGSDGWVRYSYVDSRGTGKASGSTSTTDRLRLERGQELVERFQLLYEVGQRQLSLERDESGENRGASLLRGLRVGKRSAAERRLANAISSLACAHNPREDDDSHAAGG